MGGSKGYTTLTIMGKQGLHYTDNHGGGGGQGLHYTDNHNVYDLTLTQTLPHLLFLSNPLTEQCMDAEDTAVEVGHDLALHVARRQGKVKVSWGHELSLIHI